MKPVHRILFVDDEPNVQQGLRRMLHSVGREWELVFAGSAHEALMALEQNGPFDILVSDMNMPDMDGVELFLTVKDRFPETIRFALSGPASSDMMLRASCFTHQYLTKPCDPRHLQYLLARSLALRSHFKNNAITSKLNALGSLPSIPAVYQEIMSEMQSSEPSVSKVARIIEKDGALSAKVLQIVNSAYVGLRYEISSLQQAASLMGLERLRALVLMAEVFKVKNLKPFPRRFNLDKLWRHCIKVGLCARIIAEQECDDKKTVERAYTAGLLHDIGLIVLATTLPDELRLVLQRCETEKASLFEVEQAIFNTTHAEVGGYLLELWGLPDPVVEAVAFHAHPAAYPDMTLLSMGEEIPFHPVTAVHVANYFCTDANSASGDREGGEVDTYYLECVKATSKISQWWDACSAQLVSGAT
ncbi:MAG: HDOD domain-containing protein [Candidatus Hydrogenedentes bacterium]|nr:HDOD domain-containing protein [Candidatus Hydrogenedentota bacterium]